MVQSSIRIRGLQLDNVRGIGARRKLFVSEGSGVSMMPRNVMGAYRFPQEIEGSVVSKIQRNEVGARRADSAELIDKEKIVVLL